MKIQSLSIALILFSLGQIALGQGEVESFPIVEDHGYWIDSDGVIPMLSKDEANELNAAIAVGDDAKIEAIKKRHRERHEKEDYELLPYSEEEFTELKAAMSSGDQKAVEALTRRHDERERNHRRDRDRDRRKPIDPLPDNPIPDQNEGEGESVSPADLTIDPVEGREERERRRREREQKQREKEEREREQEEYDRLHPKPPKLGLLGWIWSWTLGPILSAIFWPLGWIFTLIQWGGILALLTIALCMLAFGVLCGSVCMQLIRWMWNRTAEIIASFKRPKVEPRRYSNDPEPTDDHGESSK